MRFQPLESNPDVINEYLKNIGLSTDYGVADIIGFDEELLPFVLRPVYAVIFLYPTEDDDGNPIDDEFSCLGESKEERQRRDIELGADLYQITQTISNACGSIALIHAIANNRKLIELDSSSILKDFIDSSIDMTPDERGELLEKNEKFANAHESCAASGETEMDDKSIFHFVALIEHKGYLWRCDGRRRNTVKCTRVNITNSDTILESAAEYVTKFAKNNSKLSKYAAMSLNKF